MRLNDDLKADPDFGAGDGCRFACFQYVTMGLMEPPARRWAKFLRFATQEQTGSCL
jgi:hypothetical protein